MMILPGVKNKLTEWLLAIAIIFFILGIFISVFFFALEYKHKNKIYPHIYIGDIRLGGLEKEAAEKILNEQIDKLNRDGITFDYENKNAVIYPIISSPEGDFAYQVITASHVQALNRAYEIGREKNIFNNIKAKAESLFFDKHFRIAVDIDKTKTEELLRESLGQFEERAENAKLSYQKSAEGNQFVLTEEKNGVILDYESGLKELEEEISSLRFTEIKLKTREDYPQIYKKDLAGIEDKAKKTAELAPLSLKFESKTWPVDKDTLSEWLEIKKNETDYYIGIDNKKCSVFLKEKMSTEIDKEAQSAKFEMKDGKVLAFQASRNGAKLNVEKTLQIIEEKIINGEKEIELIVETTESDNTTSETNDLGIKEIIGTGYSSFSGSPANRKHNISTGAKAIGGLLVKPDEEFSLIKALGTIDGTTGYLQELVIKDNRTIPEYGGGLCQIGTTVFRAALASGLPITARRNHSYRVSYYEPAGTDATIYNPQPDLRFVNDSGHYILIQYRIAGNDLYFDFWGTRDGRIVEKTDPTIYNIVKPGPTKIIETLDLAPGERKCTERPHNGADAYFDYKVIYTSGETKEERFSSHYVPWREVCLLGVEKLTEDETVTEENQNATTSAETKIE